MATITGSNSNDSLFGDGDGFGDAFFGLGANDFLLGNNGNDTMDGGAGNDTLNGSGGYDIASYRTVTAVNVSLVTNVATGAGSGTDSLIGIEDVWGSDYNDTITGNGTDNYLFGYLGDDSISGGGSGDLLIAGGGNDTLNGSSGNDTLTGGTGRDDFVFSNAAGNGTDRLTDFVHGIDRLVFGATDYGFTAGHVLTNAQFTAGTTAVGTSAQFIWDVASHHLYWDADGTGVSARIDLGLLDGATVTKDDLMFV